MKSETELKVVNGKYALSFNKAGKKKLNNKHDLDKIKKYCKKHKLDEKEYNW